MPKSTSQRWLTVALFALVALPMFAFFGCATQPKIVNAWQDPAYTGKPFAKVLVVGITEKPGSRRIFETVFSQRLREYGVQAEPSFEVLPSDDKLAEDAFQQIIANNDYDAIFTSRVVGIDQKTSYSPGYSTVYPGSYYNDFYGFYSYSYGVYHTPGHMSTYNVVRLETNVYEAAERTLVWTGMTESVDPANVEKESVKLADVIMRELITRGLIAE